MVESKIQWMDAKSVGMSHPTFEGMFHRLKSVDLSSFRLISSGRVTSNGQNRLPSAKEVCNVDRVYAMGSNSSMPFACPETNVGEIVPGRQQRPG